MCTKDLLYPIKKILSTMRWGYFRSGTNGLSRALDFDLSVEVGEEIGVEIEKYSIVFILRQFSS